MTFEFNLPIPFSICFWFIQAFLAPKHPAWIESKLRNGMELNQTYKINSLIRHQSSVFWNWMAGLIEFADCMVTFVWLPVYWISVVVCLIPIHCTKTILESNQTWNSLTTGNSSNLSLLRIVSRHFIITIRSWRSNVYNYCYNNI